MTSNSTGLASFHTGRPPWGRVFICTILKTAYLNAWFGVILQILDN
jgi:hypothetical protein